MRLYYCLTAICVFAVICGMLVADEIISRGEEAKSTAYPIASETKEDYCAESKLVTTNKIKSVDFMPKRAYLNAGDVHCVVEFFIQYYQISTNFSSYAFARDSGNSELCGLNIHFLNDAADEILSVPCVNDGQDVVWGMDGSRIVQLYASFILTAERCNTLDSGRCRRIYLSDSHGNLLAGDGRHIMYELGEKELGDLIYGPTSPRRQTSRQTPPLKLKRAQMRKVQK